MSDKIGVVRSSSERKETNLKAAKHVELISFLFLPNLKLKRSHFRSELAFCTYLLQERKNYLKLISRIHYCKCKRQIKS